MQRLSDPILVEIIQTRAAAGLPAEMTSTAYRLLRLVLAAKSWDDVSVFSPVAAMPDNRYAVPVHKKWFISFQWTAGLGAADLKLERL
jgi:plasmid maintenance system killer protein